MKPGLTSEAGAHEYRVVGSDLKQCAARNKPSSQLNQQQSHDQQACVEWASERVDSGMNPSVITTIVTLVIQTNKSSQQE